jgi:hypothetical protein
MIDDATIIFLIKSKRSLISLSNSYLPSLTHLCNAELAPTTHAQTFHTQMQPYLTTLLYNFLLYSTLLYNPILPQNLHIAKQHHIGGPLGVLGYKHTLYSLWGVNVVSDMR